MEGAGGAFGGGKAATGAQDPLTFLKRPNVTIRIAALVRREKDFLLYKDSALACPCLKQRKLLGLII